MNDQAIVPESLEPFKEMTIRDYALFTGIPEATIRSRVRMGKMITVDIEVDGKIQRGIRVPLSKLHANDEKSLGDDAQSSDQSSPTINQSSQSSSDDYRLIIEKYESIITNREAMIKDYEKKIKELEKQLSQSYISLARLTEAAKNKDDIIQTKDEVIQAKEQAINAANAAVMLMEQQKQTLDAQTPKQLETALKKPWWRFGI